MPFLSGNRIHPKGHPCRKNELCAKCEAVAYLTDEDWLLIDFYRQVEGQYINQTPMGNGDAPNILTPRLEGYEAALRIYDWPKEMWPWLVRGATTLHRLVRKLDTVSWMSEIGKTYAEVIPEDLQDGPD